MSENTNEDFIDLDDMGTVGSAPIADETVNTGGATGAHTAIERVMDERRKIIYIQDCSVSMNEKIPQAPGSEHQLSKMETSRQMLRDAINERYARFSDSDVSLIVFGEKVELVKVHTQAELLYRVDRLIAHYGGTDICLALTRAIQHCKQAPSVVQVHNIVLVTDGMDWKINELVEETHPIMVAMRELGIVLDVILIATGQATAAAYQEIFDDGLDIDPDDLDGDDLDDDDEPEFDEDGELAATPETTVFADGTKKQGAIVYYQGANVTQILETLRTITIRTNGRTQLVQTADDLKNKFLNAARQLALPPAPDEKVPEVAGVVAGEEAPKKKRSHKKKVAK